MKEQKKIAIYSRKSKFTGKGESIENQIELCRQYIRINSGDKEAGQVLIYEDEGFSGGNLQRPQFKRMMADARADKLSAIVVYRLDRISRNIGDFAGLIESLNDMKVSFISIKEQFDTNSPMGRAMMYIASVFSQLERETIAERIRDNMQELAKTGRWLGGITPTGYTSEQVQRVTVDGKTRKSCKLKIVPEEAELVQLIFATFLDTQSLTRVDAFLLQHGCKTKNGKNFTRFTIKGILTNPAYAKADGAVWDYLVEQGADLFVKQESFDGSRGVMVYNRTEQRSGKTNQIRPIEDWIIALGAHQGLIEGSAWVKVQYLLAQNRSKAYRKPRSHVALLSGLLACGDCGEYMRPKLTKRENANGELIYSYVCEMKERSHGQRCNNRNVNGNLLDKMVIEEIKKLPQNDSQFMQYLKQGEQVIHGNRVDYDRQLVKLKKSLSEKEQEINALLDTLAKACGSVAEEYLLERIEKLHEGAEGIRGQIEELKKLTAGPAMLDMQFDLLRQMVTSFATVVDTMTVEQKRAAIRTCVKKIVWDGENAHLYLFGSQSEVDFSELSAQEEPPGEDSK
ncbi:MAG: recombinase family protein [Pseudoflavonifractor sp.]|nr:recombinase family protein [Pseudoflavonifractor sp.]